MPLPTFIPTKPRVWRKKRTTESAGPTPPSAPLLISANLTDESILQLTFDQPVTFDAFYGSVIVVNDPVLGATYCVASDPTILPANFASMEIESIGPSSGTVALMNAGSNSGFVSVDGGLPWAGVTNFVVGHPH